MDESAGGGITRTYTYTVEDSCTLVVMANCYGANVSYSLKQNGTALSENYSFNGHQIWMYPVSKGDTIVYTCYSNSGGVGAANGIVIRMFLLK